MDQDSYAHAIEAMLCSEDCIPHEDIKGLQQITALGVCLFVKERHCFPYGGFAPQKIIEKCTAAVDGLKAKEAVKIVRADLKGSWDGWRYWFSQDEQR